MSGRGHDGALRAAGAAAAMPELQALKDAFDPNGILNPGKLLPEQGEGDEA